MEVVGDYLYHFPPIWCNIVGFYHNFSGIDWLISSSIFELGILINDPFNSIAPFYASQNIFLFLVSINNVFFLLIFLQGFSTAGFCLNLCIIYHNRIELFIVSVNCSYSPLHFSITVFWFKRFWFMHFLLQLACLLLIPFLLNYPYFLQYFLV
jgi:hypothetical protein